MLDKKHISTTVMPSPSSSFSGYSAESALSTHSWLSPDIGADKNQGTHTQHITLNHSKEARLPSRLAPRWRGSSAHRNGSCRLGSFRQHHAHLWVHLGSCSWALSCYRPPCSSDPRLTPQMRKVAYLSAALTATRQELRLEVTVTPQKSAQTLRCRVKGLLSQLTLTIPRRRYCRLCINTETCFWLQINVSKVTVHRENVLRMVKMV